MEEELTGITTEKLKELIEKANAAYRTGNAIIADTEYDALIDELERRSDGKDPLLQKVGFEIPSDDSRKETLPIPMYSMNKVKTLEELQKWAELKSIHPSTELLITPKFDGLSLCARERVGSAWTRGNGVIGQRSDEHYKMLMQEKKGVGLPDGYSFGEVVMPRELFSKRWAGTYKNSRNMGAGALNKKTPEAELRDFEFMRFGWVELDGTRMDKLAQIELLNKEANNVQLRFLKVRLEEITEELLAETFSDFKTTFDIDGLILEVNDAELREELGRERSGNPVYARAWKGFAEEEAITKIRGISFQVSKNWLLKPVASIEPVELDGVTVSNVTLNNARFIKENGIAAGAEVKVIRSGQVIPKIIEVTKEKIPELPDKCPSCSNKLRWNENGVELICTGGNECDERNVAAILAFFTILEVENLGQGIIEQLYKSGYDSIERILGMQITDFEELDSFKEKKSIKIFDSIKEKTKEVSLEKLMHASGLFDGLGSKKLALLGDFDSPEKKPTLEELLQIDGFSTISAEAYLRSFDKFWAFAQRLPIQIASKKEASSNILSDWRLCFTGFRDKDLQELISVHSGKIVSGVSAKTTHLIVKDKESSSSKTKKAQALNIPIMSKEELMLQLSSLGIKP